MLCRVSSAASKALTLWNETVVHIPWRICIASLSLFVKCREVYFQGVLLRIKCVSICEMLRTEPDT